MKPPASEWIATAEGDLTVVDAHMVSPKPVFDVVCFLCQQAVEKCLKAWLTEQSVSFPRTHDETLGNLCLASFPELAGHMHDLRFLTSFAVEVRYPGTSASRSDADQTVATAHAVRSLIRMQLGI